VCWLVTSLMQWNRDLLEKLIVDRLVKNFVAFYGTRMFIFMFTRARRESDGVHILVHISLKTVVNNKALGYHDCHDLISS
jgi:hypothetical protein